MYDQASVNKSPFRGSMMVSEISSNKRQSVRTNFIQFNLSNYVNKDYKEDDIVKLKQLWDQWTMDKQGLLRPNELSQILTAHGFKTKTDTIYEILAEFDTNEQGGLNFDDFMKIISKKPNIRESREQIMKVFKRYDRKNKGYIDINDLKLVCKQLEEDADEDDLKLILKKCSSKDNGQITFEDFFNIMVSDLYI